ncbi:MAG: hypothetical protein IKU81_03415, partial [Oscillibacter sp.]|nr:hypothetical protein [Oscillibacter sp.]
ANILILILLTLTLVDVYFGREQKKTERAILLCEAAAKYRKKRHTGETDESYLDIMQNLQYHLFQELENHNIPYVREVAELYGGYIECFDTAEGREIEKMLRRADIDIKPMMLRGLAQRMAQLERKHEAVNALEKGRWKEDSALWAYLAKKENLDAFVADDAEKNRLLMITVTRLTLLVNDILGSSVPMYAPGIRQYCPQQRHTSLKVKKTCKYLAQFVNSHVAEKACGCNADAGAFVANLLRVAQSLRSFGDRRMQEMLDVHLAMVFFANHPLIAEELSKKQ